MVVKIYAGISVDRVHKVIGDLIDDEQGGFRTERGCVDRIRCGLPKLYEALCRKCVCGRAYNLKGIKWKISF